MQERTATGFMLLENGKTFSFLLKKSVDNKKILCYNGSDAKKKEGKTIMFRKVLTKECKELGIQKRWYQDVYFEKLGIRYQRYSIRKQMNVFGKIYLHVLIPIVFISHFAQIAYESWKSTIQTIKSTYQNTVIIALNADNEEDAEILNFFLNKY